MSQSDIEEISLNIKEAQAKVDVGRAVDRLMDNRDFQEIILDGYLKDEAVRLVHLKASPSMQSPDRQASIIRDIDGIGALLSYFRVLDMHAIAASNAIQDGEEALEEIYGTTGVVE